MKWIFPELNPDLTKMLGLEGNSRGIQITSVPLTEKLPVFPLDHFACRAAIFVLLTLISTYEALFAAEVPVVVIFFKTGMFSLA